MRRRSAPGGRRQRLPVLDPADEHRDGVGQRLVLHHEGVVELLLARLNKYMSRLKINPIYLAVGQQVNLGFVLHPLGRNLFAELGDLVQALAAGPETSI